ncbi:MAG TPA: NAD-dependent deacetylase, partial [Myxococcales bacterium]|nr:NAD-dependent deacetylase [Myxococcales bacterium]
MSIEWDIPEELLQQAAEAIVQADALLIGAGAGMGVDSGLPDFRGNKGFWNAYPPFQKRGLSFIDMANPKWFYNEPEVAWGFYGHRLHLYRDTVPHEGFSVLRRFAKDMTHGAFVYTSNVDGQFQKAGFDDEQIVECHGSIHHMQCALPCASHIWDGHSEVVEVDEETFEASPPMPACRHCGYMARPNILMFGDGMWIAKRTTEQERRYKKWLASLTGHVVVIECGAGTAIPSVRWACEGVTKRAGGTLIRINPREAYGPAGILSFECGALRALSAIE